MILVTWFGALFVLVGVLYLVAKAIWKGPMSGSTPARSGESRPTLEPAGRGISVFGLSRNWPGLALMLLGAILLLAGAIF